VMDGREAIGRIRSSGEPWAGIPVIALTADAMSGDRERFIQLGMSGYVPKPINQKELLSEIRRVLVRTGSSGSAPADSVKAGPASMQAGTSSSAIDLDDILGGIDRAVA
jgi:DNA-binding response OmpR family regulator